MTLAYNITLVICLIISLATFIIGKTRPPIKTLVILLLVTSTVELGSYYDIFPAVNEYSNHWLYNISTVFEFYFFSYFFYHILNESFSKKLIRIFVVAYPVILMISFLTIQKWYIFHSYTYILGLLYLNILCLLYFRELYTADEF